MRSAPAMPPPGGNSPRTSTLLILAGLFAMIPAGAVLAFLAVALRNQRLADHQHLAALYARELAGLTRQINDRWQERLRGIPPPPPDAAGASARAILRSGVADGVVILNPTGGIAVPVLHAPPPDPPRLTHPEWTAAHAADFAQTNPATARRLYERIAAESQDPEEAIEATLASARCLTRLATDREAAERLWTLLDRLRADPMRPARHRLQRLSDIQLRFLELLGDRADPRFRTVATDLADVLDSDAGLAWPAGRRLALQRRLAAWIPDRLPPGQVDAEALAVQYLETDPGPVRAADGLFPTGLQGIWGCLVPGQPVLLLFREDRIRADLERWLAPGLPAGTRTVLLAPDEEAATHLALVPAGLGPVLPGWRLGLAFQGADPFAEGATGHRTLYLLAGTLAAAATLALALLAVRYLRAQLELAQLRSDLVSAVTHELKTPLASTSALLETLLSGRYRDEAQWRHYLELIARENQRLGRLIDNFLAFSRLDRRPTAMTLQPLHLPAVVDTACRSMGERWSAPDCEWTVEVEPNLPELRGDPEALTAAVVNLLDNAWKYTSPPRRIGLRVFRANHHLQVEVTDNGTGIAPAEQQRVFEPYYQGDRGLTRRSAGCGLGLAIVRFVAEAHHGRAQVSSRPGGGSVFTLSLPESLAADGAEAGRRPPTPS